VLAEIVAPPASRTTTRPPVNVAIVLDRSGSMSGEKLRLAKSAVEAAIARLQPSDRFSVVVYDDVVDVIIASTPASVEARRGAVAHLATIEARGSTNLAEGWLRGCEQLASHLVDAGVNRCLLLTDGLANVGITDHGELAAHAAELRARGVSTSTFGVGVDFDESLLQDLADAGGGHFYYIADAAHIADAITSEVGETLEVVAREVTLEVAARDDVTVEPISPYRATDAGNRTIIALGDLGAEQVVQVVLRLTFPYGDIGREVGASLTISDRDGVFAATGAAPAEAVRLSWEYADHRLNDAQARDHDVDRAVATTFAARVRQEAVARNRANEFDRARRAMTGVAERIRSYAGNDPFLKDLAERLELDSTTFQAPMPEQLRKQAHFASANQLRTRDAAGHAVKRV
jgi:Ca-activated chloride channel family protein